MCKAPFEKLPGRVFLDTCVINLILDYGPQIHEGAIIEKSVSRRMQSDIRALKMIFATGQRASWQFAISEFTHQEVATTYLPSRAYWLENWFFEIWAYWREIMRDDDDLAFAMDTELSRKKILLSGMLDILPDFADRILMCDAIAYKCDAFCTRDWSTIIKYRDKIPSLPLKILTPTEWWALIEPWAPIWA